MGESAARAGALDRVAAVALGAVDVARHRLPDALTLPAVPVTLLLVAGTAWLSPGSGSVVRACVVAAALWLLFWGLAALAPAAMGRGDVKLVPSLGLLTGFVSVAATVLGVLLAFVLGAIVSLVGVAVAPADAAVGDPLRPVPAGRDVAGPGASGARVAW